MKKAISAILALVLALSLCACGKNESGLEGASFLAKITEVAEDYLTVTPDIQSKEHKSGDTLKIETPNGTAYEDDSGTAIDRSLLTVGQEVFVGYDGNITETAPAQLTAKTVKLRGVVSSSASQKVGESITFDVEGQKETVEADRVGLDGCYILVPSEGWQQGGAQNTKVGPVVISPKNNDAVSLTFQVLPDTSADDAKNSITAQYPGLEWASWQTTGAGDGFKAATVTEEAYTQAFVVSLGSGSVTILCRYPNDGETGEGYGARLTAMAESLTMK